MHKNEKLLDLAGEPNLSTLLPSIFQVIYLVKGKLKIFVFSGKKLKTIEINMKIMILVEIMDQMEIILRM